MSDLKLWAPEYRYEVNTHGDPDGSYAGNAVRFESKADALAAAESLFNRWTAVRTYRIVDDLDTIYATGP